MAYARTTIASLRNLLIERLGGNEVFWNTTEVHLALNEAIAIWQLITGDFSLTFDYQLISPNQQVIAFTTGTTSPMGFIRIRKTHQTATHETAAWVPTTTLYPTNIQEMDQGYYGRQGTASGTTEYWAPFGIDRFVIYPPSTTTATVQVQYYSGDPRMSAGETTLYLDLGDEEILRILDYAQWSLSFKEGLKEALLNLEPLKEMFLTAARLRSAKLRGSSLYKNYMGNDRDELRPIRSAEEQQGLRG